MPKIYEYFGLILMFWSNEHLNPPIHVHAKSKDGRTCKILFYIEKSKITNIEYEDIKGKKPLTLPQMRNLKALVNQEKDAIVNAWIKVFVLKDTIKTTKITTKIK